MSRSPNIDDNNPEAMHFVISKTNQNKSKRSLGHHFGKWKTFIWRLQFHLRLEATRQVFDKTRFLFSGNFRLAVLRVTSHRWICTPANGAIASNSFVKPIHPLHSSLMSIWECLFFASRTIVSPTHRPPPPFYSRLIARICINQSNHNNIHQSSCLFGQRG